MALQNQNITIEQGSTYQQTVFWESTPFVYRPISAISKTAPVSITCAGHGLVDGWRVAVIGVVGMTQLNAANDPPKAKDFHEVTVVDSNTITINSIDASSYSAYKSGGYLKYYTQVDISGYTARMTIKNKVGGTVLLQLDSGLIGGITLNNASKAIQLQISAAQTAALAFSSGVYDVELVSPLGVVTKLLGGAVTLSPEVTT